MKNGCWKSQLLFFKLWHYDLLDSLNYDYFKLIAMSYSIMIKQKRTKVYGLAIEVI